MIGGFEVFSRLWKVTHDISHRRQSHCSRSAPSAKCFITTLTDSFSSLKTAMDAPAETGLSSLLEKDWFASLLSPYLSFGDLRNLSMSSKTLEVIVSSQTAIWPDEVKELVRTWCTEPGDCLFMVGIHDQCTRMRGSVVQYRHPAPMIQFQVDCLSYDAETGKLRGQPWSEVLVKNQQPKRLGRDGGCICYANDAKTQIFVCGGDWLAPEGQDDETLVWFDEDDIQDISTKAVGIFDLETGLWTDLPSFPGRADVFSFSGVFRIGSKVFIISGADPIFCFDLKHKRWESWLDDSCYFPGEAVSQYDVIVVDNNTVIVAGGYVIGSNGDMFFSQYWPEVFSLNMTTGAWTRLPDLPGAFDTDIKPYSCRVNDGSIFVVVQDCWAVLSQDGNWEVNPDLKGKGVKALDLNGNMSKVFAGNTWLELPPYNDQDFDGLHIDEMKIQWRGYRSNALIVK